MGRTGRIQKWWDALRGKNRGLVDNYEEPPNHYGARFVYSGEKSQRIIKELVEAGRPAFLARPGRSELKGIGEFLNRVGDPRPAYPERRRRTMSVNTGFFTPTDELLTRFACESLGLFGDVDVLAAYGAIAVEGVIYERHLAPGARICRLDSLYSMLYAEPWTESLRGRRVLVVHPFEESIRNQYARRSLLFADPRVLPEFELLTLKAVQTSANAPCDFPDWFAALDHMKSLIEAIDFDVALIGAGAYGFFLAHHCKAIGKIGIQVGSFGQLLFGIKGRRWLEQTDTFRPFINEHWIAPADNERPPQAELVEGGCYW